MISERMESGRAEVEVHQLLGAFRRKKAEKSGYEKFSKIKQYLNSMLQRALGNPGETVASWMEILQYKNRNKFLRRIDDTWPNLKAPVPRKFLKIIGVSMDDLFQLMRMEKKSFIEALARAQVPETFSYRLMPALYPVVDLPADMGEPGAVQYIRNFLIRRNLTGPEHFAIMSFPGIKQITVTPATCKTLLFLPRMRITPWQVEFSTETVSYSSQIL